MRKPFSEMTDGQSAPDLFNKETRQDDEALAAALAPRIRTAREIQRERLKEGAMYRKYLDGRGIVDNQSAMDDHYHFTEYPLHYLLKSALIPTLIARWPKWLLANTGHKDDSTFQGFRRVAEQLLDKVWDEFDMQQQLRYVAEDALPNGMSGFELYYDQQRDLVGGRWVAARDILIDPDGGPLPDSWRWIGVRIEVPIEEAKATWPEFDFEGASEDPQMNKEQDELWEESEILNPDEERTRMFRGWRIYLRGDIPMGPDEARKSGRVIGKNEVIILTADGTPRVVARYDWPYILDPGDWPVELMRFVFDTEEAHPPSIFRPGHSLQEQASWNLTFWNTAMRFSVQRKVLVHTEYFTQEHMEQIASPMDLEILEVDDPAAFSAIKILNFTEGLNQSLLNNLQLNVEAYKDVMGINEIIREAKSHTTASDAGLQEKRAEQRLGVLITQVERFVTRVARKLLQMALWLHTAEDLAQYLGFDVVEGEYVVNEKSGKQEYESPFWPNDITPAQIRREVKIKVEPDSLRHVSKDQRIVELGQFMDRVIGGFTLLKDMQLQFSPDIFARAVFSILRRMATEMGLPNVEELLPDIDRILAPAAPPPAGAIPPVAATEAPPQGGMAPGAPTGVELPPVMQEAMMGAPAAPGMEQPPIPPEMLAALGMGGPGPMGG